MTYFCAPLAEIHYIIHCVVEHHYGPLSSHLFIYYLLLPKPFLLARRNECFMTYEGE